MTKSLLLVAAAAVGTMGCSFLPCPAGCKPRLLWRRDDEVATQQCFLRGGFSLPRRPSTSCHRSTGSAVVDTPDTCVAEKGSFTCLKDGPCKVRYPQEVSYDRACDCPTPEPTTGCGPRVRRAWSSLSCAERGQYLRAVAAFKASDPAAYNAFASLHSELFAYAHGTSAFLAWHRWYIIGYENLLRAQRGYECVTVPYWDWETDDADEAASDVYRANSFGSTRGVDRNGCVTEGVADGWTASDGRCLRRNFGWSSFVGSAQIASLIGETRFERFRPRFEGAPHAAPHVYTGGHMATGLSPDDPLFFVHHCNVDRIWALWQDYHGYDEVPASQLTSTHYFPAVDGGSTRVADLQLDSVMPFRGATLDIPALRGSVTARAMHSITQLGANSYTYGDDGLADLLGNPRVGSWNWFKPGVRPAVACSGSLFSRDAAVQEEQPREQHRERKHFKDTALEQSYAEMKANGVPSGEMFKELARLECMLHLYGKNGNDVFSDDFIRKMGKDPQRHRKYYAPCGAM